MRLPRKLQLAFSGIAKRLALAQADIWANREQACEIYEFIPTATFHRSQGANPPDEHVGEKRRCWEFAGEAQGQSEAPCLRLTPRQETSKLFGQDFMCAASSRPSHRMCQQAHVTDLQTPFFFRRCEPLTFP